MVNGVLVLRARYGLLGWWFTLIRGGLLVDLTICCMLSTRKISVFILSELLQNSQFALMWDDDEFHYSKWCHRQVMTILIQIILLFVLFWTMMLVLYGVSMRSLRRGFYIKIVSRKQPRFLITIDEISFI